MLELEFIGFVERTAPRKIRVTLLTEAAIRDIYMVRSRLEMLAAEIVAAQPSPNLAPCWEQLAEMEEGARTENLVRFLTADLNFHRALWRATQNKSLESSLERLVPKLFSFGIIQHAHPSSEALTEMTKLHRQLLEILPSRNLKMIHDTMDLLMEKAWLDDAQLPQLS
jgi:DNA-binding GntR family transcriptional regulator